MAAFIRQCTLSGLYACLCVLNVLVNGFGIAANYVQGLYACLCVLNVLARYGERAKAGPYAILGYFVKLFPATIDVSICIKLQ